MVILVVEDDPVTLTLVDRLLQARGHTVLAAQDPGDASFALAEYGQAPDLLLTDIVLPATTGVDLARQLKRTYPSLEVAFMTAMLHREPIALRTGLGPVLRKPLGPEQIDRLLEGVEDRITKPVCSVSSRAGDVHA